MPPLSGITNSMETKLDRPRRTHWLQESLTNSLTTFISFFDGSQMDVNFYMLLADIYAVDKSTPCTLVTNPVSSTQVTPAPSAGQPSVESVISLASSHLTSRNLTGSTVASGNLLTNLDGEAGVYFVFQDLSVRSEGAYTLKFSFTLPPT